MIWSNFGYGDINNTGTAYTGTPVPLPDSELVIFLKTNLNQSVAHDLIQLDPIVHVSPLSK